MTSRELSVTFECPGFIKSGKKLWNENIGKKRLFAVLKRKPARIVVYNK
jgi:hypothetical protein